MTKTAPICFWEKITMGLKKTLANFKLQTILILKPWGYPCTVYIPIMQYACINIYSTVCSYPHDLLQLKNPAKVWYVRDKPVLRCPTLDHPAVEGDNWPEATSRHCLGQKQCTPAGGEQNIFWGNPARNLSSWPVLQSPTMFGQLYWIRHSQKPNLGPALCTERYCV